MAFTRKALKAMGLTDEQVDSLIEMHTESLDVVKNERDDYKDKAEKLSEVQEQLKTVKSELEAAKKDDYKGKYESEKAAHEKLISDITAKETAAKNLSSFKAEAKKRGYSDKAVSRYLDSKENDPISKIQYDTDGNATNYDDVFKELDKAFPDFIVKSGTEGHTPPVPQDNSISGGKKTMSRAAEIAAKYHESLYGGTKEE